MFLWWGFAGVLAVAGLRDLRYRRIPNWLLIPPLAIAVALAPWGWLGRGDVTSLQAYNQAGAGLGLALVILLPAWLLKEVGAADVKLGMLIGAAFGVHILLIAMVLALAASAVVGLAVGWRRSRKLELPMGTFLAAGSYVGLRYADVVARWTGV